MGRVYDVRLQPPYLQRIGTFGDTTCKEESGERQLRAYVREEIERKRERKGEEKDIEEKERKREKGKNR